MVEVVSLTQGSMTTVPYPGNVVSLPTDELSRGPIADTWFVLRHLLHTENNPPSKGETLSSNENKGTANDRFKIFHTATRDFLELVRSLQRAAIAPRMSPRYTKFRNPR